MNKRIRINGKLYEAVDVEDMSDMEIEDLAVDYVRWLDNITDEYEQKFANSPLLANDRNNRIKLIQAIDGISDVSNALVRNYLHGMRH